MCRCRPRSCSELNFFYLLFCVDSYRVEYSTSPFYEEAQALTISCQSDQEVQVVTTTAYDTPHEEQLLHLKMADDFDTEFSALGETATDEIQVCTLDNMAAASSKHHGGAVV